MPRQERIEGSERVERLKKRKRDAGKLRLTEVWFGQVFVYSTTSRDDLRKSIDGAAMLARNYGTGGYLIARVVFGPHTTPDRRGVIFLREKPERRFLTWYLPEDVAAQVTPNGETLFGEWRECK